MILSYEAVKTAANVLKLEAVVCRRDPIRQARLDEVADALLILATVGAVDIKVE